MLYTDCTVTINGEKSVIDRPVVLYRGDKEVEIKFYIMKNTFYQSIVTRTTNVVSDVDASFSQLVIRVPEREPIFSAVTPVEEDGAIIFKFTAEMIDEVQEVGSYDFQIRLLDENRTSRATIPPVIEGIKVKEPIAMEDEPIVTNDSNEVNVAQVNEAVITTATQLPAFDEQGNYIETTWTDKMLITDAKLNKIEDGITGVNEKVNNIPTANTANDISIQDTANNFTATNVEGALAELFQSVSNGKSLIASAITDKGVTTSNTATFQTMADNINNITTKVTYNITKNLDNVTILDNRTTIEQYESYCTTISANANCDLDSVVITMGGLDITESVFDNNSINIPDVTGDIVITAKAILTEVEVATTWTAGIKIDRHTGAETSDSNYHAGNYIDYDDSKIYTLYANEDSKNTATYVYVCYYNEDKTFISCTDGFVGYSATYGYYASAELEIPNGTKYIRLRGYSKNGTVNDVQSVTTLVATNKVIDTIYFNWKFENNIAGNGHGIITLAISNESELGQYVISYADDNRTLINYNSICTLEPTLDNSASYTYFNEHQAIPKYATKLVAKKNNVTKAEYIIPVHKRFAAGNYGKHLYSFGAVSDVHTGTNTSDVDTRNALAYFNEKENVAFTCATGDLTDGGTVAEFIALRRRLDEVSYDTPLIACNGNHETYGSTFGNELWETYIDNPRTCAIIYGNDVVLPLSILRTTTNNVFDDEQRTFVEEVIAKYEGCRIFILCHSPLNGSNNGNFGGYYGSNLLVKNTSGTGDGNWMDGILKAHKNVFYFSGHTHLKFATQELCSTINVSNVVDAVETGYLCHLPSLTCPRQVVNGVMSGKLSAQAEAVVVDVYDNCVLYRGRDFIDNKFVPIGQFIIPVAKGELPSDCYNITYNIKNMVSTSVNTSVASGSSYKTKLKVKDGFTLGDILITMGGEDITSTCLTDNTISIEAVTGNVVITATGIAIDEVRVPMDWAIGLSISKADGTTVSNKLNSTTDSSSTYIPISNDLVYTVHNDSASADFKICYYDKVKNYLGRFDWNTANSTHNLDNDALKANAKYFRLRVTHGDAGVSSSTELKQLVYVTVDKENAWIISKDLLRVSSSNDAGYVTRGTAYKTKLTAKEGCIINGVYVTMGGKDITHEVYKNGVISIPEVTAHVIIKADSVKPCTNVELSANTLEMSTIGNQTLTATVTPTDTTDGLTWAVYPSGVVTVNSTGKVTTVENGTATVTASCGQCSASCEVTVNAYVHCTGVSLNKSTLTFTTLSAQTLTATITPDGCTDSVTWTSSNTDVATIDSTGLVTPLKNGTTTITASCGSYSATCEVTVNTTYVKVTNNLYQISNSNDIASINSVAGTPYTGKLTPSANCTINHVRITVNEEDVTNTVYNADTGAINIENITGDICINALAVSSTQTACDITADNFAIRQGAPVITTNEDGSITVKFTANSQQYYVTHNNITSGATVILYVEDVSYSLDLSDTLKVGLGFRAYGDSKDYTMTSGTRLKTPDSSGQIQFNVSKTKYTNEGGQYPVSITFRNCKLISQ